MFKHYWSALVFTVVAVGCGYALGGVAGAWIVTVLGVLEVSLSFDNAVVNASILQNWSPAWRHRFITWGMPIAVFGMRFAFPLVIVAIIAGIGPIQAFTLAMKNPAEYSRILTSSHYEIAAYGGAFLFMIFFKYFIDEEKDIHWIGFVESRLALLGKLEAIQVALVLGVLLFTSRFLPSHEQFNFMVAGLAGLITFILADAFGTLVGGEDEGAGGKVVKEGVMGMLYLELLDASFSFDGVMGAFAMSNNILIISLGLGIGAMFVRSITLHLVESGKLAEYRFLEHSAFWAIGALAAITMISIKHEIPDVVTGFIGGALVGLGLFSSVMANKRDEQHGKKAAASETTKQE